MPRGFTFTELIVVMGVLSILTSLTLVNFARPQYGVSQENTITQLIADLRSQQLRAMTGDTDGTGNILPHGILFTGGSYVLFSGPNYQSQEPSNFTVPVDAPLSLSTTFPSSLVIFSPGSGEIVGFTSGSDSISLTNSQSADSKVIQLNRYGVVTLY